MLTKGERTKLHQLLATALEAAKKSEIADPGSWGSHVPDYRGAYEKARDDLYQFIHDEL